MEEVDFRSRVLAFRGAGGEPPAALRLQESHLSHFMEVSLLLRLQVIANDVSFLVACLARSFSCGRHAPCATINLPRKGIHKIFLKGK
jgi:hypothetical protein